MRILSQATRRYILRMFTSAAAYVVTLGAVKWAAGQGELPEGPLRYAIVAIPALPVIGVMWALLRFSQEEEDEYRRHLNNRAILWALGVTLVVCEVVGLMQSFAGVGPVNLLHVFSVFWIAQLVATIWANLRAGR
jgi:hypothetical protein